MAVVHTVTNHQIALNSANFFTNSGGKLVGITSCRIYLIEHIKVWSVLEAVREDVSHRQRLVLSHHEYGCVQLCRINVFDLILVWSFNSAPSCFINVCSQSGTNITHTTYLLSASDLVAKGLLIDCRNWLRFFVITRFSFLLHQTSQCSEWHFCPHYETSRFRNLANRPVNLNGVLICFFLHTPYMKPGMLGLTGTINLVKNASFFDHLHRNNDSFIYNVCNKKSFTCNPIIKSIPQNKFKTWVVRSFTSLWNLLFCLSIWKPFILFGVSPRWWQKKYYEPKITLFHGTIHDLFPFPVSTVSVHATMLKHHYYVWK
jgi:hypothetical protein